MSKRFKIAHTLTRTQSFLFLTAQCFEMQFSALKIKFNIIADCCATEHCIDICVFIVEQFIVLVNKIDLIMPHANTNTFENISDLLIQ